MVSLSHIQNSLASSAPLIRHNISEGEIEKTLPLETVLELRKAGIFKMMLTDDVYGQALTPVEMVEVLEQLSMIDPAAGWCAMIGCDIGHYYRRMTPSARVSLGLHTDSIVAGWLSPVGTATGTPDGMLFSGKWGYGSGINHADIVVLGALCHSDEGSHHVLGLVTKENVTVDGGWDTLGLRASGSFDYHCDKVFVPSEHILFVKSSAGPNTDPYQRQDILLSKMPGVPLGAAKAAIQYASDLMKNSYQNEPTRTSRVDVLEAFANSLMLYNAARDTVLRSLDHFWKVASTGQALDESIRCHVALARYNAFNSSEKILRLLFDSFGGAAISRHRSPLEKLLRDVVTMKQHAVAQRKILPGIAELYLSGKTAVPFV